MMRVVVRSEADGYVAAGVHDGGGTGAEPARGVYRRRRMFGDAWRSRIQSLDQTKTLICVCNRGPGTQSATLGATEAASGAKGPRDCSESVGYRRSGRRGTTEEYDMTSRFLRSCSRVHLLEGGVRKRKWGCQRGRTDAWAWSLLQTTRRGYLTATGACGRVVVGRGQEESARTSQQSTEKWLLSHKCHGGYQIRHRCHVVTRLDN